MVIPSPEGIVEGRAGTNSPVCGSLSDCLPSLPVEPPRPLPTHPSLSAALNDSPVRAIRPAEA